MSPASKVLIAGGVLNIAYGFIVGIVLSRVRERQAEAPRYLTVTHMGALMHGPMLMALVFAVQLSTLSEIVELWAA